MWKLATSELLSTFFPTWLWQGREWAKGKIPKYDHYYWNNACAHPVLSTFYPPSIISSYLGSKMGLDRAMVFFIGTLTVHILGGFLAWYILLSGAFEPLLSIFGAITLTFGAVSLRQQPCIIYTLVWFPWTLQQDPIVSAIAVGMMLLAGYYPFAIYLLPIAVAAHILWFQEAWLLLGIIIGLPQIIPFLKHLPNTIKRLDDKCEESPPWERRFYVGVIPIMLLPWSTSRLWPLTVMSCLFALGVGKHLFPRVHERWLIVVQFCVGWMAVSGLNNLGLSDKAYAILLFLHTFDIYWHNKELLPPRPFCELWKRPSCAFNTPLTKFLEANLGDYKVSGLPWPLFTGHVNRLKTIGYCGSMQTKEMWDWRKSFKHDPFIDGVSEDDLTKHGIKYAYSRSKLDWPTTPIRHLYQNPRII